MFVLAPRFSPLRFTYPCACRDMGRGYKTPFFGVVAIYTFWWTMAGSLSTVWDVMYIYHRSIMMCVAIGHGMSFER